MTAPERNKLIEPTWPEVGPDERAVTEFVTDRQGSLSPFGDVTFPWKKTPYQHPETVINR